MRSQFAGVITTCVPVQVKLQFHVCETDPPTGRSKSSRQSVIYTMLELVTAKWAMKPVCHVCSADNGYVKHCAPTLHEIIQSDHSSQH